jgi:hypothetical protein
MTEQQTAKATAVPAAGALTKPRRSAHLIAYGVTIALGVVLTIFFGWYGFWLGAGLLVAVRVAIWGIPLIKLSYADEQTEAAPPAQPRVDGSATP